MIDDATDAYLTSRLDQLAAAQRDDDLPAIDDAVAQLIRDDHAGARARIADALRHPAPIQDSQKK